MGEFFQCDTGETFPLSDFLKVGGKECFINCTIDDNGVLHINRVLWMEKPLQQVVYGG